MARLLGIAVAAAAAVATAAAAGWDEGLHYAALLPSTAEWGLYFNSTPGVLHVWSASRIAEVDLKLRFYTATEGGDARGSTMGAGRLKQYKPLKTPRLMVNGAEVKCYCVATTGYWSDNTARCDCRHQLRDAEANQTTAVVTVKGWAHRFGLPLRFCTYTPTTLRPKKRVVHIFEKHGHAGDVVDLASPSDRDLGYLDTVEKHARHALYALHAAVYEVTVHEHLLPLLNLSPFLAGAMRDKLVIPLLKPAFPNDYAVGAGSGRGGLALTQLAMDYLMSVDYNLALLRHWLTSAFVFFVDPDEFLLFAAGASSQTLLDRMVNDAVVVSFQRLEVTCISCYNTVVVTSDSASWRKRVHN